VLEELEELVTMQAMRQMAVTLFFRPLHQQAVVVVLVEIQFLHLVKTVHLAVLAAVVATEAQVVLEILQLPLRHKATAAVEVQVQFIEAAVVVVVQTHQQEQEELVHRLLVAMEATAQLVQ